MLTNSVESISKLHRIELLGKYAIIGVPLHGFARFCGHPLSYKQSNNWLFFRKMTCNLVTLPDSPEMSFPESLVTKVP